MNDYEQKFLIEYFKEMRSEINLRIRDHNTLVATKVVTSGALLGFLLTKEIHPSLDTYSYLLIPIISMLYDIMIGKNISCIHRIGTFIRDVIEENVSKKIELWENYAGQKSLLQRNYGLVDIVFLSIFNIATIAFTIIVFWVKGMIFQAYIFAGILTVLQASVMFLMYKWILFFVPPKKI